MSVFFLARVSRHKEVIPNNSNANEAFNAFKSFNYLAKVSREKTLITKQNGAADFFHLSLTLPNRYFFSWAFRQIIELIQKNGAADLFLHFSCFLWLFSLFPETLAKQLKWVKTMKQISSSFLFIFPVFDYFNCFQTGDPYSKTCFSW